MQYPSRVAKQRYGKGLFASESIDIGRIIQKFKGPIVSRCKIPSEEICYALLIGEEKWLIPKTAARYINHSCNPNYIIGDDLYIKTIRSVEKGEQLTIIYNFIYPNENPGEWDPRWSFKCECGSFNCQKYINKYITFEGIPWIQNSYQNIATIQ